MSNQYFINVNMCNAFRYPKTGRVLWCCSVRNQHNSCGATVSQTNTTFVQNSEHNHPSNPGADNAAIINA